ncbi:MAG TPA: basic amino acid ABC transporter substrate-binding protein [Bacillus bacterium]|uniref:Basic amino acid ABC transporter substrate-binding protein n=1 Tax=Siminovitchia fordii TaxID=254759 RepID=A0ABQ4KB06_9BACI|nr:basic amino acid ABC transporter substrate-binding protein [Siminovitchia fordii]GIN22048.1 basic amino acid ABC transporter substrate-binding protein [Siminovitchia fordii]HBZ09658.1 basic amino acid ABC transporter substrate-binding protein [Bacillus sp. (in: firmicutes)]
MKTSIKKTLLSIIAGSALVLSACGGSGEEKDSANKDGAKTEEKKVLNVGTEATFAPFEFMDKGEVTGFDVDLLNAVAEEAGYEVKIDNTGWDAMFAGLQSKQLDLGMAGVTITDERVESYDFSHPYFESKTMIAFKDKVDIKKAEDLKGKKLGVQNGTTGQFSAEKVVGKNSPDISKYETAALMFQALQGDNVEAAVTDIAVALEYQKKNPDAGIQTVSDDKAFEPEYYGIVFPKGSELVDEFNTALNTVLDNGKYAEIYKKWFDEEPDVEALKKAAEK